MNIPAIIKAVEADDFSFMEGIRLGKKAYTLTVEGLKKSVKDGTFPKIHGYAALARVTVSNDAHVTHLAHHGLIDKSGEKGVWVFLPALFVGLKAEQSDNGQPSAGNHSQDAKSKQIFYAVKSRAVENMVVFTKDLRQQVADEVGCRASYVGQVMLGAEERGLVRLQDRKMRGFGYQIVFLEEAQPPAADPRIVDTDQEEPGEVPVPEDPPNNQPQPAQAAASVGDAPADVSAQSIIRLYDDEIAECDRQIEAETARMKHALETLQAKKDGLSRMRDEVRHKAEQVRESIVNKQ